LAGFVFSEFKIKGKYGMFKASRREEAVKNVIRDSLGAESADALMSPGESSHKTGKAYVLSWPGIVARY
jgi:hypothetical protein